MDMGSYNNLCQASSGLDIYLSGLRSLQNKEIRNPVRPLITSILMLKEKV